LTVMATGASNAANLLLLIVAVGGKETILGATVQRTLCVTMT